MILIYIFLKVVINMKMALLKYITLKVEKNMTVFMSLILILRRFIEMGLLSIFKSPLLVQTDSDFDMAYLEMGLLSIFKSP